MNQATSYQQQILLDTLDSQQLLGLCGQLDSNIHQIEQRLQVKIIRHGSQFSISGKDRFVTASIRILEALATEVTEADVATPEEVHLLIQQYHPQQNRAYQTVAKENATAGEDYHYTTLKTKKGDIKPRGKNQQQYVRAVLTHDINFGIGPAGTGKTYLAVACAVQALISDEIERILLVRPAVEAGEKLGFLPGDLSQKVDPYLRPLYDALYDMLGFETVDKLIERNVIEVAPLAYMRGRTLNNAFVILDESQNTTREQMKMFLTRLGFGTTAVINGDPTQIDLPKGQYSGLKHAAQLLEQVEGISFTHFTSKDVVRHPLVQRIIDAYDQHEKKHEDKHGDKH